MNKNKDEIKICGLNSCLSYFKSNPKGLIRLYFEKKRQSSVKTMVEFCVKNRLAYHLVNSAELEKISESKHHEGICLLGTKPKLKTVDDLLQLKGKKVFLCLEGIENPHNLGAIVRTAAHFGIAGIIITQTEPHLTSAFYRVSEGGAFSVPIAFEKNIEIVLKKSQTAKVDVFATSSHQGEKLYLTKLSERVMFVMGAEGEGLNPAHIKLIKKTIQIDGKGLVESLNVSVASSLLIGEWFRQNEVPEA